MQHPAHMNTEVFHVACHVRVVITPVVDYPGVHAKEIKKYELLTFPHLFFFGNRPFQLFI